MRRIGLVHALQKGTKGQVSKNDSQSLSANAEEGFDKVNSVGPDDLLESLRMRINDLDLVQRDTVSRMNEFEAKLKRSTVEFLNLLGKGPQ